MNRIHLRGSAKHVARHAHLAHSAATSAEAVLRDIALVLHLARRMRAEILSGHTSPSHAGEEEFRPAFELQFTSGA